MSSGRPATVMARVRPTATDAFPAINPKDLEVPFVSHLLGPNATQEDCRHVMEPLKERFLCKLESVVIFAYGQTGAGKTHTILGPPGSLTETTLLEAAAEGAMGIPLSWGLFPSIALSVFRSLPPRSTLKVSVVEVYMDRVYDLLNNRESVPISGVGTKAASGSLTNHVTSTLRDSNGKWVNPEEARKLEEKSCRPTNTTKKGGGTGSDLALYSQSLTSEADVAKVSRLIEATRTTVSHNLNERSSRSHCIITLKYSTVDPATNHIHTAAFTFADLAGSERVKSSGVDADDHGGARAFSLKGTASLIIPASRFDEARNVNSSLASLSRLMVMMGQTAKKRTTLGARGAGGHLPWRDSTLNLVLKDCFLTTTAKNASGSSTPNMVILMAVREDVSCKKETDSTYRFGKVVATTTTGGGSSQRRTQSVVVGMGERRADRHGASPTAGAPALALQAQLSLPPPPPSQLSSQLGGTTETCEARTQRLEGDRSALMGLLRSMQGTSEEGGVNKEKEALVQQDFLKYKRILDENTFREKELKQQLLEVKARLVLAPSSGSNMATGGGGRSEVTLLQEQMEVCKHKIFVHSGLVARMIYSGCYQPPSKKYVATQRQLREVEAELEEFL